MDKAKRERFEAWAITILGDNPTWRESAPCELAWQAWKSAQLPASGPSVSVDEELLTALVAILPMAKGYAASNRVGNNSLMIEGAEAAIQRAEASNAPSRPDIDYPDTLQKVLARLDAGSWDITLMRECAKLLRTLVPHEQPSGELGKSAEQEKVTRQYYFQKNECKADSAKDADCICWWDEGTGPFPDGTDVVTLEWRIVEKEQP